MIKQKRYTLIEATRCPSMLLAETADSTFIPTQSHIVVLRLSQRKHHPITALTNVL